MEEMESMFQLSHARVKPRKKSIARMEQELKDAVAEKGKEKFGSGKPGSVRTRTSGKTAIRTEVKSFPGTEYSQSLCKCCDCGERAVIEKKEQELENLARRRMKRDALAKKKRSWMPSSQRRRP